MAQAGNGSEVKSTHCFSEDLGLLPSTPAVSTTIFNSSSLRAYAFFSLTSLVTRHTHGAHAYMLTKYSCT